jgi:hypothetical protein
MWPPTLPSGLYTVCTERTEKWEIWSSHSPVDKDMTQCVLVYGFQHSKAQDEHRKLIWNSETRIPIHTASYTTRQISVSLKPAQKDKSWQSMTLKHYVTSLNNESLNLSSIQRTFIVFCWPCIIVYQYSETNVMHFLLSLLRIKGLYMFRALLAHPFVDRASQYTSIVKPTWCTFYSVY